MPNDNKQVKIGMFTVEEILNLKAPGIRGTTVAELLLEQCHSSLEFDDEPAYLLEIDGSYVDVHEVEGDPMDITIRHAGDEHEPDQATAPSQTDNDDAPEYTFKDIPTAYCGAIQPHDAIARKVAAIAGPNNHWAAYEGPANWPNARIVFHGICLPQETADLLFYVMRASARLYGDPSPHMRQHDIRWHSLQDKLTTRPCDVQNGDAFAIKVVAVAGYDHDWAAYQGPALWPNEDVARNGDKLLREQADLLFPVMRTTQRYYRS
jgi:hypothetical protein